MEYGIRLFIGFIRAIFWSGGFYWRLPLLVGLLPEAREEVRPVLEVIGISDWPNWHFWLLAAVVAVIVVAARLAYVETAKLRFESLFAAVDGERTLIRLPLRNISWSEPKVVPYLIIHDGNGSPLPDSDNDMVLKSKQSATSGEKTRFPIILRTRPKVLEIASVSPEKKCITIEHETGRKELDLGNYRFRIDIDGAGWAKTEIIISYNRNGILIFSCKNASIAVVVKDGEREAA